MTDIPVRFRDVQASFSGDVCTCGESVFVDGVGSTVRVTHGDEVHEWDSTRLGSWDEYWQWLRTRQR